MSNSRMIDAAHGLSVMKALSPTRSAATRKTACSMSFTETLISVRTRVETVSLSVMRTSLELTMEEYQEYIWTKIDSFPFSPTRPYDEEAVKISAKCWNRMKDDPAYEEKMMNIIKEGRQTPDPFFAMGSVGSYCIMEFDGGEGCRSRTFSKTFGGSYESALNRFNKESKGAFWSNRHKRHEEQLRQAAQDCIERLRAMQAENLHVHTTRLIAQGRFYESVSSLGAGLPVSETASVSAALA